MDANSQICIMYLGTKGGGSLFTLQLIQHLRRQARDARILTSIQSNNVDFSSFENASDLIEKIDIGRHHLKIRLLPRIFHGYVKHARTIKSSRPSMVIVTMNSPLCVPAVMLLRAARLRIVYVAHDAEPHPGDFFPCAQRIAHGVLMACAHEVVALSRHVQASLLASGFRGRAPIRLIPLGTVETVRSGPHPAMPPKNVLALLFFGRLLRYKGLQILHDALLPLRVRSDWRLTIAGDGPFAAWVRQRFSGWPQIDLEIEWLSESRIDTLMDQHHLLVCPYTEASQSGVVSRAMARGLPTVVTPVGGLPEQVGPLSETLVARATTAEALSSVLANLLDEPTAVDRLSRECLELSRQRCASTAWAQLVG